MPNKYTLTLKKKILQQFKYKQISIVIHNIIVIELQILRGIRKLSKKVYYLSLLILHRFFGESLSLSKTMPIYFLPKQGLIVPPLGINKNVLRTVI